MKTNCGATQLRLLPQPAQKASLAANARPQLEQKRALFVDDAADGDDDVVLVLVGLVLSLLAAVDQKPPALTSGLWSFVCATATTTRRRRKRIGTRNKKK
jgi:hypothetical protein